MTRHPTDEIYSQLTHIFYVTCITYCILNNEVSQRKENVIKKIIRKRKYINCIYFKKSTYKWTTEFTPVLFKVTCIDSFFFLNRMFLILDLSDVSLWLDSGYVLPDGLLQKWCLCLLRLSHPEAHDVHLPLMMTLILITQSSCCLVSLLFSPATNKKSVGRYFKTTK